jgi:hypothetical protein
LIKVRVWFDRLTMIGEKPLIGKNVRPERFDPPFALSLSKGGRFVQHRFVEGFPFGKGVRLLVIRT